MSTDPRTAPDPAQVADRLEDGGIRYLLATMTDQGIRVGFGATKCLKFTKAGAWGYLCTPHGFVGTATVQ